MSVTHQGAEEQQKLWNGSAGRAWVDAQEVLDGMFEPFQNLLADAVSAAGAEHVLDVGCGTGSTTIAFARKLGGKGRCVGIDISEPMLAVASQRAQTQRVPASFICADAQSHTFEPASFDRILSRFGVMFFDDPVRAFANLRAAAKAGAELRFIAWRSPADNPFMTTAERAAAPFLPKMPARSQDGPGQFAFADPGRVQGILEKSGWMEIHVAPVDIACTLPERELSRYLSRLGPVGMVLEQADDETRSKVTEAVRAAFEPYVHGAEVRFTAACWVVDARAHSSDTAS